MFFWLLMRTISKSTCTKFETRPDSVVQYEHRKIIHNYSLDPLRDIKLYREDITKCLVLYVRFFTTGNVHNYHVQHTGLRRTQHWRKLYLGCFEIYLTSHHYT